MPGRPLWAGGGHRDWYAVGGASESDIEQLCRAAPCQLPASYLSLLRTTNGGEGPLFCQPCYLVLDAADEVKTSLETKQYEEFFPGFIIIGTNGAGEYIALDTREDGPLAVVAIDMTNSDLVSLVLPIAPDFDAFADMIGRESPEAISD